jgi:thiamine-phosphate pyrophosphorylase
MKTISRLHYITQDLPNISHAQLATLACKGGVNWVQLRMKKIFSYRVKEQDAIYSVAQEVKKICKNYNAKFIVNDYVFIAKEIHADGIHLGKEDMNPKEARKILGDNFIIGGSANTIDDAKRMLNEGCDYIGVGPFRFTSTKTNLNPILGIEGIRKIAEQLAHKIPMIAIGGIRVEDIEALMQTGIHGVAVSSAINLAEDKIEATKKFLTALEKINR